MEPSQNLTGAGREDSELHGRRACAGIVHFVCDHRTEGLCITYLATVRAEAVHVLAGDLQRMRSAEMGGTGVLSLIRVAGSLVFGLPRRQSGRL